VTVVRAFLALLVLAAAAQCPVVARTSALEPRFTWPLVPAPKVTRPFEAPASDYGPGHRGVDLAATPGQPALASGEGVVVFAGLVAGFGVVSIDHDGGLRTTYEPVTATVTVGTRVYRGQPVGTVNSGHPGCPVVACLHWGVRHDGDYLDPVALIRTESVIRLKPWDEP
jgi:murein DD-endopeptidase MepM/ murein hydrolase activator NlpD